MVNVFSSLSSSMTFSPHSFNWEIILNNAKLYSLTVLKSTIKYKIIVANVYQFSV